MKTKLFVLLLCTVSTLGVPVGQSKPRTLKDLQINSSPTDLRIVGGSPATLGQFPWQVAIQYQTVQGWFFCGGSLISNQWVLTAAHCADGAWWFTLYAGTVALNYENMVIVNSVTAIVHPQYNSQSLNNDVALVKLDQPLTFTDNIRSVRLPSRGEIVGAGVSATASGWGVTSDDEIYVSNDLNYVPLTTISNAECAQIYGTATVIGSTLCAVGNPYNSTCFGDSGGPFVTYDASGKATQVGVVSFVSSWGCAAGHPSGYARTESFLDWIAQETGLIL